MLNFCTAIEMNRVFRSAHMCHFAQSCYHIALVIYLLNFCDTLAGKPIDISHLLPTCFAQFYEKMKFPQNITKIHSCCYQHSTTNVYE